MFRALLPVALAILLLPSLPANAQDDALRAAVERYINNPVQQRMMDDMFSPDAMVAQMRAVMPQITEEELQSVAAIAAEELAILRPDLETAMIEAAIAHFTLEEVEALDAFYSTPEGASVMVKMQPFMATAMGLVGPQMMAAQMRIGQRAMEELSGR